MSHSVQIQTSLRDSAAISAAYRRIGRGCSGEIHRRCRTQDQPGCIPGLKPDFFQRRRPMLLTAGPAKLVR